MKEPQKESLEKFQKMLLDEIHQKFWEESKIDVIVEISQKLLKS